ncbi:DUF1343 domain-containing protein [candidate division KSB1 bacterium]|nr:DUF1343 domain-containing protein [candidate division KSB1 bacterium]
MNRTCFLLCLFTLLMSVCSGENDVRSITPVVKPGIDVLLERNFDLVNGKHIGLITNATGITRDFRSTIDVLYETPNVQLTALFGPEHGVRGDIEAGQLVPRYTDERTDVTVFSLYGKTRKPTPDMLSDVDVLIYDIQDIGSRAYTFIYTMALGMQAAQEKGIPFIVLDRPNPLGGIRVEGNVLDPAFSSFIGLYPIPYIYGMTVGELAQLFNHEFGINCELHVVPMAGWRRDMLFEDTGLIWVPTSPHVPHASVAFFVATTGCLGELHTVSEGVGYTSPFEIIGAPWINSRQLADNLNARQLPGVYFRPMSFRPYYLTWADQQCKGVQIHIADYNTFQPAATQIHILDAIQHLYPERKILQTDRTSMFDKANGTDRIRLELEKGTPATEIIQSWQPALQHFLTIRKKYLLYD